MFVCIGVCIIKLEGRREIRVGDVNGRICEIRLSPLVRLLPVLASIF